ncbi:MAG: aspartate-alanine antiporter [Candidatus Eremiobacteraeota bacterium]|nr:aspartate-alanine antiporter [Candidatus Eremiobacteraeota bacterium]
MITLNPVIEFFRSYPQVAIFLALALGYSMGKLKFRGFALGSTTSVLLVAIIMGQMDIEVPGLVKTISFGLFTFGIGYKVGPQFFGALRKGGLNYLWMALIVAAGGLTTAIVLSKILGFDPGTAAGILSGAMTTSACLGTSEGAISHLALPEAQKAVYSSHVAIAYAITYIFGTGGTILFLKLYPRLVGLNVKSEAKKLEQQLAGGSGGDEEGPGFFNWAKQISLRAYLVQNEGACGRKVRELEALFPPMMAVEKIRNGNDIIAPAPDTVVEKGNLIAVAGTPPEFVKLSGIIGPEVFDGKMMEIEGEVMEVCVLNRDVAGKTLGEVGTLKEAHGVFLKKITRQGHRLPIAPGTEVQKCDILELAGKKEDVERAAGFLGYPERPAAATDLIMVGLGCALGTLIGLLSIKLGGIAITLGIGGGVLVAGLICGWLRSLHPTFGQIPAGGLWLMTDLGLNLFIACTGLSAGSSAFEALKSTGLSVFLAGAAVSILPAFAALLFGQFVLKMNPVLLLGSCCGARDITAALLSIQDDAESSTPALGFAAPYAFANVFITVCGSLIINIMARL